MNTHKKSLWHNQRSRRFAEQHVHEPCVPPHWQPARENGNLAGLCLKCRSTCDFSSNDGADAGEEGRQRSHLVNWKTWRSSLLNTCLDVLRRHMGRRWSDNVMICLVGSGGQVDCWRDGGLMKRGGRCAARPVGNPQLLAPLIPTVWRREEVPHRAHAYSIIDPVTWPYDSP